MEPLLTVAQQAVGEACQQWALVVHDWSQVLFRRHHGKRDRLSFSADFPEGYTLQAALLLDDRLGAPLAPLMLNLHAAHGVYSSHGGPVRPPLSRLDELEPAMRHAEQQRFSLPLVHIVDAEADSVAHYRQWNATPDRYFLVRADDRLVEHAGVEQRCSQLRERARQENGFRWTRRVEFHGQQAEQWVAEVPVLLTRPGQQNRPGVSRRRVPGTPLPLRLVIVEIRSDDGQCRATWYLLSNLPANVPAATIALWYYWRWRIEDYFKLLKSAGMELEHWQQESAAAIAKRLLVASMACVVVWQLARDTSTAAEPVRRFLVRLSGRQMRRGKTFTTPALLAGLWTLLITLQTLETYDIATIKNLAAQILPRPPNR